jgi:hypothetical protein
MLDKYGKDGLAVIGVTLDDPKDAKARANAAAFLEKRKVPFRNFALDVPQDKRPVPLDFINQAGVPGVFIFNRDNRYVKKLPVLDAKGEPVEQVTDQVIDKTVVEQIKNK